MCCVLMPLERLSQSKLCRDTMGRIMFWVISIAVIYVAVAAMMYVNQRNYMYFPDTGAGMAPQGAGLQQIEQLTIATADGERLEAWYAGAKPGNPTILFFHGNAGHISYRADRMAHLTGKGAGALFVSYRGYGASTGTPTEQGLTADALAAYDWLISKDIQPEQIALIGESLGSAVAVQLAARRQVRALVLEAPFTSAVNVAREVYWWLPVNLLMKDRFESLKAITKVKAPVLVVHGERDEIIGASHGKTLYEAASPPKKLSIIEGGSHNGFSGPRVWDEELAFVRDPSAGKN